MKVRFLVAVPAASSIDEVRLILLNGAIVVGDYVTVTKISNRHPLQSQT